MSAETAKPASGHPIDPIHVFDRVLCGVDGSDESTEAVTQANALAPAEAQFTVFGIVDTVHTVGGVAPYGSAYTIYQEGIETLVEKAARSLSGREPRQIVVDGPAISMTRELLEKEGATLVAVGARHANRAWGIVLGSLATDLAHAPRTPVLLARKLAAASPEFPRTIVVGYDGSAAARRALGCGRGSRRAARTTSQRARRRRWVDSAPGAGGSGDHGQPGQRRSRRRTGERGRGPHHRRKQRPDGSRRARERQ